MSKGMKAAFIVAISLNAIFAIYYFCVGNFDLAVPMLTIAILGGMCVWILNDYEKAMTENKWLFDAYKEVCYENRRLQFDNYDLRSRLKDSEKAIEDASNFINEYNKLANGKHYWSDFEQGAEAETEADKNML